MKISSNEELNKRKERFKDDLEELEKDEKTKEKFISERGRIRRTNFRKNNFNTNYHRYRRSNRDNLRGGRFHERRFRGDKRNNYRKQIYIFRSDIIEQTIKIIILL